jgi:hypothetical protein
VLVPLADLVAEKLVKAVLDRGSITYTLTGLGKAEYIRLMRRDQQLFRSEARLEVPGFVRLSAAAIQPTKRGIPMSNTIAVAPQEFTVPRNFAEFAERYPTYIRDWVRRRKFGRISEQEVETAVSDLTVHMLTFPEGSIFCERGFNDRIEAFNPEKGATASSFFHYVKRCLNDYYVVIHERRTAA